MPAVFSSDGRTARVWKVDAQTSTVQAVEVSTGAVRDGSLQIVDGLTAGDTVAVSVSSCS